MQRFHGILLVGFRPLIAERGEWRLVFEWSESDHLWAHRQEKKNSDSNNVFAAVLRGAWKVQRSRVSKDSFRHFVTLFKEGCVMRHVFKSIPRALKTKLTVPSMQPNMGAGVLDLSHCGITDPFAEALAEALKVSHATSCHVMPRHATSCHVMPRH